VPESNVIAEIARRRVIWVNQPSWSS